jgi:diguanylate cyclase (GGDEF)-like protein
MSERPFFTLESSMTAEELLRASWHASVQAFTGRITRLLTSESLYDAVKHLLEEFLRLVEHPSGLGPNARDNLQPLLAELRAIQTGGGMGTTETVLFLFFVKDILDDYFERAPRSDAESAEVTLRSAAWAQVSALLNRLGLVLFESDVRAREEVGSHPNALAIEYGLLYERARRIAITDQLTSLHNFGYFLERLKEERARAERYQRLLSLIIFDLDHFKAYNDAHGHPAGNQVLKTIANILNQNSREGDLVARYGGEEMVIVLPEATRREATEMAERIRRTVESTPFADMDTQPQGHITLSAGVATYPVDAADEEELIQRADETLYAAKRAGRNRVEAYLPPHKERLVYRPGRPIHSVALVGNFNNWDKDYDLMRPEGNGEYEFIISLNPGVYQYKFVIDGAEWIPDPGQSERCPDTMGGENSVLRISRSQTPPA